MEGGGATTFDPRDEPDPLRDARGVPPAATVGGGARTLVGRDGELLDGAPVELTAGGGGTASDAPKSLPTMLLKNPLPDCVGGGGTTVFEGSVALLLERRRMS